MINKMITDADVKHFKSIPLNELTSNISCHWAVGQFAHHLKSNQINPENGEYIFVLANPEDIKNSTPLNTLDFNRLWDQQYGCNYRIADILRHWSASIPLDPPLIACDFRKGTLEILDGRHRILVAHVLGTKLIPVAIHASFADRLPDQFPQLIFSASNQFDVPIT